ncbi:Mycolic acid cyclopropane synthetase-domain-containing protein [Phlyctochytrium arcticum]|nr:Mycolic acid cyclopropane synthetase-domain-containing protein [Phlyctochytrium arcticum]
MSNTTASDSMTQRTANSPQTVVDSQKQQLIQSAPAQWARWLTAFSPYKFVKSSARSACLSTLSRTKRGFLRITLENGQVHEFGDRHDQDLRATLQVVKDTFWVRLMLFSAMGFGEAYMYGEITATNLATLLKIVALNRDNYAEMQLLPVGLNSVLNSVLNSRIPNTILNAVTNIQAHYDLGNEMFGCFLDPSMMYSCPIWDGEDDTLEAAQYRKIHAMLDMAAIEEGMHVLEVGTGWGALAIEAVRRHGCRVTTLTLSKEQKALAEKRIAEAGLTSAIDVQLLDYRNMNPHKKFDRIIAIEMLEAVGPEFLPVFFQKCHELLHPANGIVALQVITMPDSRYQNYLKKVDFIQRHIFPGGHCPSMTALVDAVYQGSKGNLILDETRNIGPHYAKALRIWREKFMENCDKIAKEHNLEDKYDEVFKRKWEYYFAYCEAGFATRTLGNVQLRLSRANNNDLLAGIPM